MVDEKNNVKLLGFMCDPSEWWRQCEALISRTGFCILTRPSETVDLTRIYFRREVHAPIEISRDRSSSPHSLNAIVNLLIAIAREVNQGKIFKPGERYQVSWQKGGNAEFTVEQSSEEEVLVIQLAV